MYVCNVKYNLKRVAACTVCPEKNEPRIHFALAIKNMPHIEQN